MSNAPYFAIVSPDTAQHITLNDRMNRAQLAQWIIGYGTRAIAYAVLAYASRMNIPASDVQYAVRPLRASEV